MNSEFPNRFYRLLVCFCADRDTEQVMEHNAVLAYKFPFSDNLTQGAVVAAILTEREHPPLHGGRAGMSRGIRAGQPFEASQALGFVGIGLFLLLWETAPRVGWVNRTFLPEFSLVAQKFFAYLADISFWTDVGRTMTAWAIGLIISIIAGVVFGFAIGLNGFLKRTTRSTIEFLRPIPSVALVPLAVLLFGLSIESSLMLIVYACFWQVLIQVLYGVGDVDPVAESTARAFGLGRFARMRHVVWPTVLPYLMTGVRLASTVAIILAITAELLIGQPGIGYQIGLTQAGGRVPEMYALIVATGFIGVVINIFIRNLERQTLKWHPSVTREGRN